MAQKKYIDAKELQELTGLNDLKCIRIIAQVNRWIKEDGGIVVKGMAPIEAIEKALHTTIM